MISVLPYLFPERFIIPIHAIIVHLRIVCIPTSPFNHIRPPACCQKGITQGHLSCVTLHLLTAEI